MTIRKLSRTPPDLLKLNAEIRLCRKCKAAGYLQDPRPVVMDGGRYGGIVLIGQAPGIIENENGAPFGGRAGRELFRWLASVGVAEADFRDRVYMSAVTRCFPGKATSGSGDRKPSPGEIGLCRPWFDAVLESLNPQVLLLVGKLAIDQYIRGRRLDELVGQVFDHVGTALVPLPHPSGSSRWMNNSDHRLLLAQAMARVRELWDIASEGS